MNNECLVPTTGISNTDFCIVRKDHCESMTSGFFKSILQDDISDISLTIGNILSEFSLDLDSNLLRKFPNIVPIRILMAIVISLYHIIRFCLRQSSERRINHDESSSECCTDLIHTIDNI